MVIINAIKTGERPLRAAPRVVEKFIKFTYEPTIWEENWYRSGSAWELFMPWEPRY